MEASVTDPDGSTELCEIMDEEDFHYRMMFTPQMEGTHTLSIKHKGLHISGTAAWHTVCIVYFWISRNWFGRISKICIFKHRMMQEQFVCLPFIYMCLGTIIIHGICMQPLLRKKMTLFCFHWIIGSPFVYSVGQLSSGGTHKVQVGGPGVEKGEVGFSSKWNLTQCVCRSQPYNAHFK